MCGIRTHTVSVASQFSPRYAMGQIRSNWPACATVRYTKQHRINVEYKFTTEYFAKLNADLTFQRC